MGGILQCWRYPRASRGEQNSFNRDLPMRQQTAITVRLSPAEIEAVDAVIESQGGTRARVVREAVRLSLSVEGQAQRLREESQTQMRELVVTARASDMKSRSLVVDFLAGIADLPSEIQELITQVRDLIVIATGGNDTSSSRQSADAAVLKQTST